ncbi:MAG: hypothetical protein M1838_003024 [Thelocarpon superellum]|nr:MAG: hypothetical protein M1838_003024 [Thelocarpon superellum]
MLSSTALLSAALAFSIASAAPAGNDSSNGALSGPISAPPPSEQFFLVSQADDAEQNQQFNNLFVAHANDSGADPSITLAPGVSNAHLLFLTQGVLGMDLGNRQDPSYVVLASSNSSSTDSLIDPSYSGNATMPVTVLSGTNGGTDWNFDDGILQTTSGVFGAFLACESPDGTVHLNWIAMQNGGQLDAPGGCGYVNFVQKIPSAA